MPSAEITSYKPTSRDLSARCPTWITSESPTTRPQTVRIRFVRTLFRDAVDIGQARPCGPWITYVRRVISLVGNLLSSFFVPNRFASGIKVVSGIATTGKEG